MAIRAGQILHLGGDNLVLDRLQSAGISDINIGSDIVQEVGNYLNVDKILQDPDLSFSLEGFDVSTEVEAILVGDETGGSAAASGTEYCFSDMGSIHVPSPWKDETTGSAGTVDCGVLTPNLFLTSASYSFGVDDNASQTFELATSEVYMAEHVPVNEYASGDGATSAFTIPASAARHRVGGYQSGEAKYVLGVIVDGDIQLEGTDYTVTTAGSAISEWQPVVTFTAGSIPANGAGIHMAYFDVASGAAFPQTIHPTTTVKPAAVRGRDIQVFLHVPSGGAEASGTYELKCVQSVNINGSRTTELERCMGEVLPVGRTITQTDVTGDVTIRKDACNQLHETLRQITGVASGEVIGLINDFEVGLEVRILNPNDRTQILKTIWVDDAKFQIPAVNPQVAAVVDFQMNWESKSGEFCVIKEAAAS